MVDPHEVLEKYFGYTEFRPGQEELISAVLSGRDVLGIMPTGAGKSICYQIPSLLFNGLTLVISPLISLMLDQVLALKEQGIRAAFLNSTLTYAQQQTVFSRAANGAYQVMYIAPERLASDGFRAFCRYYPIPFLAVDEAHCISQWGHNFRPDYLNIAPFIASLPKRPVVGAFTATATQKVRHDIVDALALRDPKIRINSFDRENLFFEVRKPKEDKEDAVIRFLNTQKDKSGIIYCSSRKAVEEICELLQNAGYPATRYHAGLSEAERTANQNDFLYDRKTVMVATNAFGMGIDKSNVSFVLHYQMPKSIEAYYQEAGRAGRDGSPAVCTLLYTPQDVHLNEFLITKSIEENGELTDEQRAEQLRNEQELLKQMTFYCTTHDCLRNTILRYFGEKRAEPCGDCGNCRTAFENADMTEPMRSLLGFVRDLGLQRRSFGRVMLINTLRGSKSEKIREKGLDASPWFGSLKMVSSDRANYLLDYALNNGWLVKSEGDYPVILPTPKTTEILQQNSPIVIRIPKETGIEVPPARKQRGVLREEDPALFEELRRLRRDIADTKRIPAYMIFNDETLHEMAALKPVTERQFQSIRGVGESKTHQYAKQFIEVILKYK